MGVPMEGIITDKLKGGSFIVQNDDGILSATCKPCGKMTMNKITLTVGDRVKVELSEYDLTRGRIMYRL